MKTRAWLPAVAMVLLGGITLALRHGESGLLRSVAVVAVLCALLLGAFLERETRRRARMAPTDDA
jgi:hypothetical protein